MPPSYRVGPNRVPHVMHSILVKRLTVRGFIVSDFAVQYPKFLPDMSGWLRKGRVKHREVITDRLEKAPRQLIGLLKGENFPKKIIRVSADTTQG
jgi:NADPH-dependent curcumin reductase CurA